MLGLSMAIWGEVPGFDSVTRKNFVNRKPPYDNSGLPHLDNSKGVFSYTDHDIVDIIGTLDTWVAAWPGQNDGKPFAELAPEEPQGRIIDMVYYHKHANDKAWKSADKEVIMALAKDDDQEQNQEYLIHALLYGPHP